MASLRRPRFLRLAPVFPLLPVLPPPPPPPPLALFEDDVALVVPFHGHRDHDLGRHRLRLGHVFRHSAGDLCKKNKNMRRKLEIKWMIFLGRKITYLPVIIISYRLGWPLLLLWGLLIFLIVLFYGSRVDWVE